MTLDIDALLNLWTRPHATPAAAARAFAELYTDPVLINGAPMRTGDLVARAAALRTTFPELRREVLDVCEAGEKVAVAFRMTGRQVGPWTTSAGVLPPTGREISLRVIDILTLTDGRISSLWMVGDELAALAAHEAVTLSPATGVD